MKLTIIIVNWNTNQLLNKCLSSIIKNTSKENINIIVVDNSSSDGSRDMVENCYPRVRLINSGSNIGFGRANNLALKYANTPYVLFLNPDTEIIDDAIQVMYNHMKDNYEIGAMSCKIKYGQEMNKNTGAEGDTHHLGLQWFPSPLTEFVKIFFLTDKMIKYLKYILPFKNPFVSDYVSKLYGTCLLVRKEVLEKIGSFDEQFFMYGEDVDLSRRIIDGGWKLYYMADAEIIHHVAGAKERTGNQFSSLMMCESISKLMNKYYGSIGLNLYKMVIFIGSATRMIISQLLILISYLYNTTDIIGYQNAKNKYTAMLKWSINKQKPIIKQ